MRSSIPFTVIVLAFTFSGRAEEDETRPKDIAPLNQAIAAAIANGEAWIEDPSLIAGKLTGPWLTNDPEGEPGSQSREIGGTSKGESGASGKVTVTVREIGLFDDAVRQIDHTYEFTLKDRKWTVTAATERFHNARPSYPAKSENRKQRQAGVLLCGNSCGAELAEQAKANGIDNFAGIVSKALDGDRESLVGVLRFSTVADGAAAEIYAELVFGLSCVFDGSDFRWFLFANLEEDEREAVEQYIAWIESDAVPD